MHVAPQLDSGPANAGKDGAPALTNLRKMGSYVVGGMAAQGIGAVSGLLLTRWLDVADYAVYTVAMTMVGAIAVLTKGGTRMGLASLLSDYWPDKHKVAVAVASAVRTRFFISALTMPIIVILTAFLLYRTGASWTLNLAVNGLLVAIWWADMRSAVIDQVLNFNGQAVRVQMLDTVIAAGRLVALALLWLANSISVVAALVVQLLTFVARIRPVRAWVHQAVDGHRMVHEEGAVRRVRTIALRQVPVDVFSVVQAQAALFFLTASSANFELATYGALGRVVQLLAPFTALSLAFFTPAFAKAQDRIVPHIAGYAILGTLPALGFVALSFAAPQAVLFLLGPVYKTQVVPLQIFALCTFATTLVSQIWSLTAHRGWNKWSWVRIPIGLAWIAIAPFVLPVHTAEGAFIFFAGFSLGTLLSIILDLASAVRTERISLWQHTSRT